MRKIASIAALAGGLVFSGAATAENYYASQFDTGGTTNVMGSHISEPMVVGVDRGTVRERPNAQSKILTTMGRGAEVMVVGTANGGGWAHVMVDGLDGYMDFVQLDQAPPPSAYDTSNGYAGKTMVVAVQSGDLYLQPTIQSQLVASLPPGSPVVVIDRVNEGGWAHVRAGNLDGYMDVVQLTDTHLQPATYAESYPVYQATYTVPVTTYAVPVTPVFQYHSTAPAYRSTEVYQPPLVYQTTSVYQPTAVYQPTDRVVNLAGGTIHQEPNPQSPLLATLPPGNRVTVVGSLDGGTWLHVVANGVDGYMDYSQLQ